MSVYGYGNRAGRYREDWNAGWALFLCPDGIDPVGDRLAVLLWLGLCTQLPAGKLFCKEKKYRDKGRASTPHAVIIGFLCCCFRYGTLLGINTLADRGKTQQAAARALKLEKERRTYCYRGISRGDTACFAQVAENELTGLPVDWMT